MRSRAREGVLAVALCLLLSGCVPLGFGQPSYDEELSVVDGAGEVAGEQVSLADGSELAVGYVGSGEFAAQWKDPEGDGWTAPETVVEGDDLAASGVTLETDGATAVASFSWYGEDDDERESYARVDAAVCRDVSCETVEDVGGSPMLAQDGQVAAVPLVIEDEDAVAPAPPYEFAIWEALRGEWEEVTLEGPPLGMDTFLRPAVVLLDNGRLATVNADTSEGGCRYELWAGAPRSPQLTRVARTASVGERGCVLQSVSTDGTDVSFLMATMGDGVTFSPAGAGWTDDLPQSGLLGFDDEDGRSGIAMYAYRLDDDSTTAIGSPDGRRIVAQYRAAGEREWTRPRTVARAPAGQRCRATEPADLTRSTDVVYLVSCWPTDSEYGDRYDDGPPPTSGFALGSHDGRRWVVEELDRPAYRPIVQLTPSLLVAPGGDRSLVWRRDARGFEVVDLPLPNPTVDALAVIGDEAFRVTGNPDEDRRCRPRWDVAPLGATSWSYGGPIRPISAYAREPADCYGAVSDEVVNGRTERAGRRVRVVGVIESLSGSIDGELVRRGDTWRPR